MSKKKKQTGVRWLYLDVFNCHVGFCPDEKSWKRCMKKYGVKSELHHYPSTEGRLTSFEQKGGIGNFALITINDPGDKSRVCIDGLIVHEVVHAFFWLCDIIHEYAPSTEFRSYTIQHIFMSMSQAFNDTIGYKKDDRRKRSARRRARP